MNNNGHYLINEQENVLEIRKITLEETASYSCIAENFKGRIETFFKLDVLGKKSLFLFVFYLNQKLKIAFLFKKSLLQ